jgi:hypothetical protein
MNKKRLLNMFLYLEKKNTSWNISKGRRTKDTLLRLDWSQQLVDILIDDKRQGHSYLSSPRLAKVQNHKSRDSRHAAVCPWHGLAKWNTPVQPLKRGIGVNWLVASRWVVRNNCFNKLFILLPNP